MKVYVAVTEVTEAATALTMVDVVVVEAADEAMPVRLVASLVLVVAAELIVPTVVVVQRGGAYQPYIAPIFWANGSVNHIDPESAMP